MSQATVLVVDDEFLIRWSLRQRLEDEGHAVIEAASGEEAMSRFAGGVDLVLLDYRLPDTDGLAVLERMRGEDPGLPALMITAHGSVEHAARAERAGVCHYAHKPFDLDEIARAVRMALERSRLGSAPDEQSLEACHSAQAAPGAIPDEAAPLDR